MNKLKIFLGAFLFVLIASAIGGYLFFSSGKFGSGTSTQTFGGNVVVTGTLTANGGVTTASQTIQTLTAGTIVATGTGDGTLYTNGGLSASSTKIGGVNASKIDLIKMATSTIDANALTAWSTTSITIGLTGAKVGDLAFVTDPYSASGTVIRTSARVRTADFIDIDWTSNTSTASFNPASGIFTYGIISSDTN